MHLNVNGLKVLVPEKCRKFLVNFIIHLGDIDDIKKVIISKANIFFKVDRFNHKLSLTNKIPVSSNYKIHQRGHCCFCTA